MLPLELSVNCTVKGALPELGLALKFAVGDRKSTRLNSSHLVISYAVFCLKKTKSQTQTRLPSRTRNKQRRKPRGRRSSRTQRGPRPHRHTTTRHRTTTRTPHAAAHDPPRS